MNTPKEEDKADDDSATFTVRCLSAISTILDSVSTLPQVVYETA